MTREMWVYGSEKRMRNSYSHLSETIRESGFEYVIVDKYQRRVMQGMTLGKLLDLSFWGNNPSRHSNEPLFLKVPGERQTEHEVAVAYLNKAIKRDENTYLVPVKVFSRIDEK